MNHVLLCLDPDKILSDILQLNPSRRQVLYSIIDLSKVHCEEYPNRTPVLIDLLLGITSEWEDVTLRDWLREAQTEWHPRHCKLWEPSTRPDFRIGVKITGSDRDQLRWLAEFTVLLTLLHQFGDFACVGWR